ncbi:MAG: glycosyltransferase [candidate division NC10 bacterium]|nr:glycosyltransferase [candidate division NC10 bacterium]
MADGVQIEGLIAAERLAALDATGPVELLVGVPTLNHARSVARVVENVVAGLAKQAPAPKAVVLVADAGSRDGTLESIRSWRETARSDPAVHDVRLMGPPNRGRAILAILTVAQRLRAHACGLVDADLISVTPVWIGQLLLPVIRGEADFVSPVYSRTVSEGTLTTNLLAPMTQALYGRRLQHPLGGCVGLSEDLVGRYLQADIWTSELAAHGVDLWLATEALVSGARVMETHLGRKIVEPPPGQPDLATTVARVVGPLFRLMEKYHEAWEDIRGSVGVPLIGHPAAFLGEPGEPQGERMVRAFRLGLKDLLPVWEQIMPEETLARLYPLGLLAVDEFRFPVPTWARVVSDFALAYHARRLPRDHLLRALTPLYLGRVAAFLLEARGTPPSRFPQMMEAIGQAFEVEREFLRARWR